MSIEHYVYTAAEKTVPRAKLREALAAKGWTAHVYDGVEMTTPAADGALGDDLIVGWPAASPKAQQVEAAVRQGGEEPIERLYQEKAVGSCHTYISEVTPEEWEEQRENLVATVGEEAARRITQCPRSYCNRTTAGRNNLSLELQEAVWTALAELTDGWREDPQGGTWRVPPGQNVPMLPQREPGLKDVIALAAPAAAGIAVVGTLSLFSRFLRWLPWLALAALFLWLATM